MIPELRTIAKEEKSASAYFNLGYSLYEQKDLSGSEVAYRQSILLNLNNEVAHNNLAVILRDQENLDASIESLQAALRLNPNYALAPE